MIILKGHEAEAYILLRNQINAFSHQAKAAAKKLEEVAVRLSQLTK